jgi:hypothetical protein
MRVVARIIMFNSEVHTVAGSCLMLLEQHVHLLCVQTLGPEVIGHHCGHCWQAWDQVALKQQFNGHAKVIGGLALAILGNSYVHTVIINSRSTHKGPVSNASSCVIRIYQPS